LNFKLVGDNVTRGSYVGELRMSHEITNILCERDGSVGFTSVLFAVQRMTATGQPWPELASLDEPPEPWPFYWQLKPTVEPYTLQGTIGTSTGVETHGTVKAVMNIS
jgi:hypothetical protein